MSPLLGAILLINALTEDVNFVVNFFTEFSPVHHLSIELYATYWQIRGITESFYLLKANFELKQHFQIEN